MVKRHKKSLTLAALFLLLAQVFMMTFCNVTAIAVTKDQNKVDLFDTDEYGKASISYEAADSERLKWTVHLEKNNQTKTATRLSLDLLGDGQPVTPEQIQTSNLTDTAISFSNKLDDGQVAPKVLEGSAGSDVGTVEFTFETSANYQEMVVKPILEKVGEAGSNVLSEEESQGVTLKLDGKVSTEESTNYSEKSTADSKDFESESSLESSTKAEESSQIDSDSKDFESGSSSESSTEAEESSQANSEETTSSTSVKETISFDEISTFANVSDGGSLPNSNELVIRPDYDNALDDVTVSVTGVKGYSLWKKYSSAGQENYGNLNHYKYNVFTDYGAVNGAYAVILDSTKDAVITVNYKKVGTYNGQDIGATLTFSNILRADSPSWTGVNNPVIDVASCLYSGMVYDNIKGLKVNIAFTNANGTTIPMDQASSFMTFASLNSNDGQGAEYVFPDFDTTAYRTSTTAIEKGIPTNSNRNTYPYDNNEAYYGARGFGDALTDPDYINGAVSFNLNGGTGGSEFTLGSLASRAWTSFMSSVLVPIDPGQPTKTVTEATTFDNRQKDELDILVKGQENKTLNDENIRQHSYFINQPLYDAAESIARPSTIELIDTLPAYVTPKKITLLQADGDPIPLTEGANSDRLGQKNDKGRYEIDFKLTADEMKQINFLREGISWRIDVEVDDAYVAANELNQTITMTNGASVFFWDGDKDLFGEKKTNDVATKVVPDVQDITVEKRWANDEDFTHLRQKIVLKLQQKFTTDKEWSDVVDGSFEISANATGDELQHTFQNLPRKEDGKVLEYRVVELVGGQEVAVPGYSTPAYSTEDGKLVVTNRLRKMNFQFTKTGGDNTPLKGAKFEISGGGLTTPLQAESDDNGLVKFPDLPISPDSSPYTLTEIETPAGYQLGQNGKTSWDFKIVENGDSLDVQWVNGNPLDKLNQFNNQLKPFDLTVNKKDDLGNVLKGAEFTLTGPEGFETQVLPNAENPGPISEFTFTGLAPGTYTLTETKEPDGYAKLSEAITITINEDGKVKVTGANATSDLTVEGNNTISFDVKNKKKVPLPSTGGPGTLFFSLIGMLALGATGLYFYFRKDQEVA